MQVDFLKNAMIELCCPKAVYLEYMGGAKNGEEAKGTLKYDEMRKSLNTYTTSLHAINSAVVKMGKLTVATKVYRGISGRNCHALLARPSAQHLPPPHRHVHTHTCMPFSLSQAGCFRRSSGRPISSVSREESKRCGLVRQ